jgi:signal transduction histidine kinase
VLVLPLAAAVVLWIVAGSAVLSGAARGGSHTDRTELLKIGLVGGLGLLIVLCGFVTARFAWLLSRDISELVVSTRQFSDEQLPQLVRRFRRGETSTPAGDALPPIPPRTTEIARVAAALAGVRQAAADAAARQARLGDGISRVFVSLARRSQSLLQRQLSLIDELEHKADDPAALAELFQLDHLTTRIRRHAEGLIILSGAAPGRSWADPVPVVDVVRAAIAEVEDYPRVTLMTTCQDAVIGHAVAAVIHLLAELIENAVRYSPPGTRVEVRAERVAGGVTVEIEDHGLGIMAHELHAMNSQLASSPDFDAAKDDQLGLFVVGKLAAGQGIQVALRRSPYGGTTAVVLLPRATVAADAGTARLAIAAADADSGPLPGLPRRVRQASLSAQLRERPPIGAPQVAVGSRDSAVGSRDSAVGSRDPERIRGQAAALQTAWQRGRGADGRDAAPVGEEVARPERPSDGAPDTVQGEEA